MKNNENDFVLPSQNSKPISFRVRFDGCLLVVILGAIACISVNECNRSKIRLEKDKIELENMKKEIKPGIRVDDVNAFNIARLQKQR